MSASLNEVKLIGNLGGDVELRKVGQEGNSVATISLATTYRRDEVEKTEWHRVVLWNELAERAAKYLAKGSSIYVSGYLRNRKWTDEAGVDHYATEVIADSMQMLGSRRTGATGSDAGTPAAPASKVPAMAEGDVPF